MILTHFYLDTEATEARVGRETAAAHLWFQKCDQR